MITNNHFYDQLKFLTQVLLPALGTLYFALAGIWDLPSAEEVVGTVVAIDTFLGVLLHLSSNAYANSGQRYDGAMLNHGEGTFSMRTDLTGNEMEDKREIILKVTDAPPEESKERPERPKPRPKGSTRAKPRPK